MYHSVDIVSCSKPLSTFWLLQSIDETLSSLSYDIVYCQPVFNCEPGNEVSYCTRNKSRDTCTPCREGEIQPQLVSSLDKINAKCFSNKGEDECPLDELIPAREVNNPRCGIPCLCNVFSCYYGDDPCRCRSQNDRGCDFNMTMNRITGECEPCPLYTFKNNTGCGPCYYNEMEWQYVDSYNMLEPLTTKTTSETPRTTQRLPHSTPLAPFSTNFPSNENTQDLSNPNWFIAFVVVLCLAIVFAVISSVLAYFLYRRRKNDKRNTATRTHTGNAHDPERIELRAGAIHQDSDKGENELDETNSLMYPPQ
ncbi:hypothetical protein ACJMK2_007340 [Sinanodonta woodiana]|uniref:Uncharacterized protein n=1 Tax=Sinanodonta woodiana TaxID=1069815 RepID=A0ABD3VJU1_SINWO